MGTLEVCEQLMYCQLIQATRQRDHFTLCLSTFQEAEGTWKDSAELKRQFNFQFTVSIRPHYVPGVDSASNRNEYWATV
jgi:hypothetical protein